MYVLNFTVQELVVSLVQEPGFSSHMVMGIHQWVDLEVFSNKFMSVQSLLHSKEQQFNLISVPFY